MTGEADVRARTCDRTCYPHFMPTERHHGYCYCPEEQLFTRHKTHPAAVSRVCSLLSQTKTVLATNTWAPQTLLVEADGPPAIAAPILPGKWPARPQDCRQWQSWAVAMMAESHLPSPPSATAAITLLAMDASLQLKSTFPSHKSQFKSNN